MKITRVSVYQADITGARGGYPGSDGMERVRCRDRWTGDAQWTLFRQ